MARFPRRITLLVLGTLPLWGACLSPTLPLPPPSPPEVEQIGQGQYQLTGAIPQPGVVIAINTRTSLGGGEETERDYRFPIAAERGDEIRLWYVSGTELSEAVFFTIDEDLIRLDDNPPPVASDAGDASSDGSQ